MARPMATASWRGSDRPNRHEATRRARAAPRSASLAGVGSAIHDRPVQLRHEPARDGYYEAVFYTRPRRSIGRVALWALAVLVFLAGPIALLIALIK
jgi:hypothetical protein